MEKMLKIMDMQNNQIGALEKYYLVDEIVHYEKQVNNHIREFKLTNRQKEVWKVFVECDYNKTQTARELGVSRSTISRMVKMIGERFKKYADENNIEIKSAPYKYINITVICELYKTGYYTHNEIAELLDINTSTVTKTLKKYKVESPTYSRYNKTYTIEDIRSIFAKEGYTLITSHYENVHQELEFICPEGHRDSTNFFQWNMYGRRCLVCNSSNKGGNYTLKRAERHKDEWINKKGYVYVVRLYNSYEDFYKIGMSVNFVNRFTSFPYKVKVIKIYDLDLYSACYVENWLHNMHKDVSYTPTKEFGGYTECFSELLI